MIEEHDDSSAVSKIAADDDLVRVLFEWESQSRQHWGQWRKEAQECYKFIAGDQWSGEEKAILQDESRVPIVFNRVDPMISAVIGAEILNRQEVTYLPREMGDVKTNEIINDAAQWVRQCCDAADEESDAFADAVITGLGWTETRMDYEEDPEGLVRIDRVSPLEMWVDPSARKRGLTDRRYQWRGRWMDRHEVKTRFPKDYDKIISATDADEDGSSYQTSHTSAGDDYEHGPSEGNGDAKNRKIWVRHFQWWDLVPGYRVVDPMSGQTKVMQSAEYRQLIVSSLETMVRPPQAAKMNVRRYHEAFLAGKVLLGGKREIDGFSFHAITGKRDEHSGTWYGLVRAMRDPQKWANKWFSQIMHILNTSAKGGLMVEENTFTNPQKALDEWSRPDGVIELKPGGLSRVLERKSANYPQGLDRLMQFSFDAMPQVSGINLEMMGLVGKDQPGVLEAHRKQAGYAILAQFFDALKLYRKRQGKTLLEFIQNYLSDGRLIRITGDNGAEQYIPLIRNDDTVKYDVIVDDAPMSSNQKQVVWSMLVQMMPLLKDAPLPGDVWADLIRYSPLPSSVSGKLGQALAAAQQQPPDPMVEQAKQTELAKGQAEVQQKQASAARDMAEAEATATETQMQASLGQYLQ
jgi:hypothetical protein